MGDERLTAKQRTRISGVTIEGKLAVRGPGYEPFDFATTIGKGMAPGGTFRTLLPGEVAICVVVPSSTRNKVLALTGITPRAWRSYVRKWEDDRMAHRCANLGRGSVTLFYHPRAVCPVPECGKSLPPERKQRAVQAEAVFRPSGSSVPRNVLKTGMHQGTKRGMHGLCLLRWRLRFKSVPRLSKEAPQKSRRASAASVISASLIETIAALLNQSAAFPPPDGFVHWTGYAVRVATGEVVHAA